MPKSDCAGAATGAEQQHVARRIVAAIRPRNRRISAAPTETMRSDQALEAVRCPCNSRASFAATNQRAATKAPASSMPPCSGPQQTRLFRSGERRRSCARRRCTASRYSSRQHATKQRLGIALAAPRRSAASRRRSFPRRSCSLETTSKLSTSVAGLRVGSRPPCERSSNHATPVFSCRRHSRRCGRTPPAASAPGRCVRSGRQLHPLAVGVVEAFPNRTLVSADGQRCAVFRPRPMPSARHHGS